MSTVRLTMAQAVVRYLAAQMIEEHGEQVPLFGGVWAIFGHGNVAGLGEALSQYRDLFPTYRGQNEQSMAHAAIAYAKAQNRRRMMAVTASAGPGSTNMVTAAALAHVNRLPVLFLPGDTFATRMPDPVLQQLETFHDQTVTTNDAFRPVSRLFDRITRPEQLLTALPQALRVLTDPAECGPVTLAMPQDVQTMAWDFPERFFRPQFHRIRRPLPDSFELESAVRAIRNAERPLLVAGGGVHYAGATEVLADFVQKTGIPVGETQAGKGALPWHHPQNVGAIGVTGASSANALAAEADLVIAVGTRLADFTSGSRALIHPDARILSINTAAFDAVKHYASGVVGDAGVVVADLRDTLAGWKVDARWQDTTQARREEWLQSVEAATTDRGTDRPTDAEVIGAVNRSSEPQDVVVCAAGGLPGELHKLWRTEQPGGYHMEYGYSCMGYEIAGGLGVRMARKDGEVFVMVGDGSYLMLNSEILSSVMLGQKLILVVLDNGGYGCIHRLQQSCGNEGFNNLLADCRIGEGAATLTVDFAAHARALGAEAEQVVGIAQLEAALQRARAAERTCVISLQTDALGSTEAGGAWWDVAVAEVSENTGVRAARQRYEESKRKQARHL